MLHVKFVAVLQSFTVRAGFVSVTLDLDARNAERAGEIGLEGAASAKVIASGGAGVRSDAFVEGVSVLAGRGRRLVLAFPRPMATDSLETMIQRQVVVEIKKTGGGNSG